MSSTACPSANELRAFCLGDLPESAFDRISDHLGHCIRCASSLETMDQEADGLVAGLQTLVQEPSVSTAERYGELLAIARQAMIAPSKSSSTDISLDPGRKYARRLADGPCHLGKFELQEELGAGSFGYVFRARDCELDRTVALKIQRAGALASEEDVQRFMREARSVAQLQHPSIVALYETGQTEESVCFLVTEFIEGKNLEERLQSGKWTFQQTAELMAKVAEALQFAHDHGVIHRDIKPSNILIDKNGQPHLMDFGLAKRQTGELTMTSDGRIVGTPAYMSPEQARGESHHVDARSDIYSLGVIMYEMLTGERPFHGNRRLLLLQVLEDEPRSPRRLNYQIPRDLEIICLKAIAKSPGRRYQTAQELADDLTRFLNGQPIQARPVGYRERLWRWCRRNPLAASLLLAVSLGSIAGFFYLSSLSTYFVQESALESARMEAAMLEEVNLFYSDVLGGITGGHVRITHEYATRRKIERPALAASTVGLIGSPLGQGPLVSASVLHPKRVQSYLPLPATFTIDLGQRISETGSGMKVRLYSDHPWRDNGGPKSPFEATALDILQQKIKQNESDLTWYEFTEMDGRHYLRFAKAQIMKESCVRCHNSHKMSPKKKWKEGELAGVLALVRPLDRDITRTRAGLSWAFLLMAIVAVALASICLIFALRVRVRAGT